MCGIAGIIAADRLHPDERGFRTEDLRHARDVGDHASDERIDHLERGDVDQHAPAGMPLNRIGEVVLQSQGELVVHVDLDGDEQELAHAQERDALHVRSS